MMTSIPGYDVFITQDKTLLLIISHLLFGVCPGVYEATEPQNNIKDESCLAYSSSRIYMYSLISE